MRDEGERVTEKGGRGKERDRDGQREEEGGREIDRERGKRERE